MFVTWLFADEDDGLAPVGHTKLVSSLRSELKVPKSVQPAFYAKAQFGAQLVDNEACTRRDSNTQPSDP
jgi:hypothetical protein